VTDRSVAIVTDSTADLPAQLVRARAITVVPLTLHFEGLSLLDGVDIKPSEFYRKLPNANTHPTTSQPAPGRFAETYEELLANHDEVVSIHISEKLSGTYASAVQGAEMTDPQRIHVVDSQLVSMSLGLLTLAASEIAVQGGSADSVVERISAMRDQVQTYFSVATLEFLRRGGRIGRANAMLGSVLQVAARAKTPVGCGISTSFGCPFEGDVPLGQLERIVGRDAHDPTPRPGRRRARGARRRRRRLLPGRPAPARDQDCCQRTSSGVTDLRRRPSTARACRCASPSWRASLFS